MSSVKVNVVFEVNEELATACVGTSVRHGYCASQVQVIALDKLVLYRGDIRVSHSSSCRVSSLNHEISDHSVKNGVVIDSLLDQVFEVLDGYYMGSGLIRHDRVGFFYDAIHFRVGSVQEFAGERTGTIEIQGPGFGPVQGPDLTLTGGAKLDGIVDVAFSHTIATFAATYRAHQTRNHKAYIGGDDAAGRRCGPPDRLYSQFD